MERRTIGIGLEGMDEGMGLELDSINNEDERGEISSHSVGSTKPGKGSTISSCSTIACS